jgi:thiol:disulfide interchange protein DsbD
VTLGLQFKMEKGWHVYWKNPGDSGQAPQVKWSLPPGFTAEGILWPVPKKHLSSGLVDYGYEGEVLLLVPLRVPPTLKKGQDIVLSAKVKWLVCKELCLPGEASLSLSLPVKDRRMGPAMRTRDLFQRTRSSLPLPLPEDWRVTALRGPKDLKLSLEGPVTFKGASFFPATPGLIDNAAPQAFRTLENGFELGLARAEGAPKDVGTLEGVLVVEEGPKVRKAYAVSTKLYHLR